MRIADCHLLAALLALAVAVPGRADVRLDLTGLKPQAHALVDAAGHDIWRLGFHDGRGGVTRVTGAGELILGGQSYGELSATLLDHTLFAGDDCVFEARFILSRQEVWYGHLLFLCPRVVEPPADGEPGSGKAYRISYQFLMPNRVANAGTGFWLYNTALAAYRSDPLNAAPLAGARYRLVYGREYVARAAVHDVPGGVNLRFYLHDTTLTGDDAQPLFEFTDISPERLAGSGAACVQVGGAGLIRPAPPLCFRGLRLYPPDQLDAARASDAAAIAPTPAEMTVPPATQRTELPNVFGDGMVLQRERPIPVWGHGIDGDEVRVSLAGDTVIAKVADGTWRADLPARAAGGPYELTVTGRDRAVTLNDVLVGDVWVLGGQSNMCWGLESTTEAATEVPRSDFPHIRLFMGWHPASDRPMFNLDGGQWKAVSPALQGHFSAVGYYFAKQLHQHLGVPIGLLDTSTPATGIETWVSDATAHAMFGENLFWKPNRFPLERQDPSIFYNGKVAPVMPFGITGMVWYQGDGSSSAVGRAYRGYIPALIRDWRAGFGQGERPFLIVQLPRFGGCSPEMRESDLLAALNTPKTGLAVTLDIGERDNIHPRNKRPVGERLALLARALAYGETVEAWGPIYRAVTFQGGRARLDFDHVGAGLELRGEGGWEVGGADGRYVPAHAQVAGTSVMAWSEAVPQPLAVRYAWASWGEFSLYNRDGLLASPFRTREDARP